MTPRIRLLRSPYLELINLVVPFEVAAPPDVVAPPNVAVPPDVAVPLVR